MTKPDHHALDILAGCPTGATVYALEINCKITLGTLRSLQARGLVRQSLDQLKNHAPVPRWHITNNGRAMLQQESKS